MRVSDHLGVLLLVQVLSRVWVCERAGVWMCGCASVCENVSVCLDVCARYFMFLTISAI